MWKIILVVVVILFFIQYTWNRQSYFLSVINSWSLIIGLAETFLI